MDDETPENSPAIYPTENGGIAIRLDGGAQTCWVTQRQIADLFGCSSDNVGLHLKSIYEAGELEPEATTEDSSVVQNEGGRDVRRTVRHYNLDAILAVGYRVNSAKATQFRKWATKQLAALITEGFAVNEARLAQDAEAVARLADIVRRHRLSEKNVYQKMRDIFKEGSSDYDPDAEETRKFFAHVQDMLYYAIVGQTASQILRDRCTSKKDGCGIVFKEGEHPTMDEAKIAKNYLDPLELRRLENVAEMWMNYVESRALMNQRLTMAQMLFQVQTLLKFLDLPIMFEYPTGWNKKMGEAHVVKEMTAYKAKVGIGNVRNALRGRKPKRQGDDGA